MSVTRCKVGTKTRASLHVLIDVTTWWDAPTVTGEEPAEDWRAHIGEDFEPAGSSADRARSRESGRGRQADTPGEIPARGWWDILAQYSGRRRLTVSCPRGECRLLFASRRVPGVRVVALFDALNVVYTEREARSPVRLYATTLACTLAGVVFTVLTLTGVIVLPMILEVVGLPALTERLITAARWPVLLLTITGSLTVIYRYGPSRNEARWRWVTWCSAVAALLWIAASMLFSWYVDTFDSYNRIYGSFGAAVGFMVWLWISAVIVLIGGELNAEMEYQTARNSTRGGGKPLGSRGAVMADHVGKAG